MTNAAWERQIMDTMQGAVMMAKLKPDAKIGVAVDDAPKRDYFVRRLKEEIESHPAFPPGIVFKVAPVDGSAAVEVRKVVA